jgi:hypothetical protein
MATLKNRMKDSLRRAHRVLESVELSDLSDAEQEEITVSTFENCREAGYAVAVKGLKIDLKIVWAECRNSDEMVAYVGKAADFGTGNIPNEHVYEQAVYFSNKKGSAFKARYSEERCAAFIQKMVVQQAKAARREMDSALATKKSA